MQTRKIQVSSSAGALLLLLLLCSGSSWGQVVRDRVYGQANAEDELGAMVVLQRGGYLMLGQYQSNARPYRPGRLYILRLNSVGDTVWTKRHLLPGCAGYYPDAAIEDGSGRVLVSGRCFTVSGTTQTDAFLALLSPQGDTLWTKRTFGLLYDNYTKPQVLPNGDFLVGGNLNNSAVLMRLNTAGQVVWQQTLVYAPGDIGYLSEVFPVAGAVGQFWAYFGSTIPPYPRRYLRLDANGPTGQVIATPGGIPVTARVVTGTEYLTVNGDEVRKLDASFNTLWTQTLTAGGRYTSLQHLVATPDGNFLAGGEAYRGSNTAVTLNKISPTGTMLADTVFSRLGSVYLKGLAIEPTTGDYVFAGYASNGPIGGADIYWTQWRRSLVTATRARQTPGLAWSAYPNPVADDQRLHLQAEQPLRGTLHLRDALGRSLATWPAAGQRTQTLALPALPAGIYLLTLDDATTPPRTLRLVVP